MATSNLISKSLGQTYVQSGNGTPNHSAPISSLYTDLNTNLVWINNSVDGNIWTLLPPSIYGEIFLPTNTTVTTSVASLGSFISLSGLTWNSAGSLKGFTRNNQKLTLNSGCTGTYRIMANMSFVRNSTANSHRMGISVNGSTSIPLNYQSGSYVSSNKTVGHGTVVVDRVLNDGDSVELLVTSTISPNSFYVRNASLIIYRVL